VLAAVGGWVRVTAKRGGDIMEVANPWRGLSSEDGAQGEVGPRQIFRVFDEGNDCNYLYIMRMIYERFMRNV
jgi:hypothetical protein